MNTSTIVRMEDLVEELRGTDDVVRLLSHWAGEPVRLRLKQTESLTRPIPLDLLQIHEPPVVWQHAALIGTLSERPLALIDVKVMIGRLSEGVSRVFEISPEQPLEGLLRAYSPEHYARQTVNVTTVIQEPQTGFPIGLESEAILVAGSGLDDVPRPLAHTRERIGRWLVSQRLGVQVEALGPESRE